MSLALRPVFTSGVWICERVLSLLMNLDRIQLSGQLSLNLLGNLSLSDRKSLPHCVTRCTDTSQGTLSTFRYFTLN